MGRRRCRFSLELVDPQLERRELMSRADVPPVVAALGDPRGGGGNRFHQNGINGLLLHKAFVNQLNSRLTISKDLALRVTQSFQVFETNYKQLPVNPPAGSAAPTLDGLIATLKQDVAVAVTRREFVTQNQQQPSAMRSIRFSPLAPTTLVPFSEAQVDQMAATLSQLPPVTNPDGTLSPADPSQAIDRAVNAILNAVAQTTIHPKLFLNPGYYYLNPNIQFHIGFTGAPAASAAGFFIRGPHGTILPGATLHPHAPN